MPTSDPTPSPTPLPTNELCSEALNETQEFGPCTSIVIEMRLIGLNADQSRALQGPIVAAVSRHYSLEPKAVTVLGHRTLSRHDDDAHADDLHRRLHPNHTEAVVDLELRERREKAPGIAARASEPMDPWVLEALRREFADHGATEKFGIDVEAVEVDMRYHRVQVDIE